ncbi:MAG: hypothetical protein DHS20C15_28440 [Planctomycetota bacterium]|nr:MAG: hypothetical protein DHS20C15_28440 [Planctomycetota bacterium]
MSAPRTRSTAGRAALVGLFAVLLIGAATWFVLRDEAPTGDVTALSVDGAPQEVASTLPPRGDASASSATSPELSAATTDSAQPAALSTPDPLVLRVRHAHGPAAGGGRVVVLSRGDQLLAQGALDVDGRWEQPGVDQALELYVLGLSPAPGRLSLDVGRGEHEIVLPAGAVLAGRVLVNGAPPGRRFPIRLSKVSRSNDLPAGVDGVRALSGHGGLPRESGALLTDEYGYFLVSGFAPDVALSLDGPSDDYALDVEMSTPQPVRPPHDDVLLALRRLPVVHGRIVRADGSPASDVQLDYDFKWQRPGPYGDPTLRMFAAVGSPGRQVDEQGFFSEVIEDHGEGRCLDPATGDELDSELCAPAQFSVELFATHPTAGSARFSSSGHDPRHDVDAGVLVLAPAEFVRLRVLNARGERVESVRVELGNEDFMRRLVVGANLHADADGVIEFALEDAPLGFAFVGASHYETAYVELPAVPPREVIDVQLVDASSVTLNVTWPANSDDLGDTSSAAPAKWIVDVSGVPPLFTDADLPHTEPGMQRWGPRSFNATPSTPRPYRVAHGNTISLEIPKRGASARIDALQPHTSFRLRLHSRSARPGDPQDETSGADITYWSSESLWLEPGEQRVIEVDLSAGIPSR